MKHLSACLLAACIAPVLAAAAPPAEIIIPGERLVTESLTSTVDGSVIIGSLRGHTIFRAKPGAAVASAWLEPAASGLDEILGVFADDRTRTLWTCSRTSAPDGGPVVSAALYAFDLSTGAPKGRWPVPTAGGYCNDIAVGTDGTVYATDTRSMEILSLPPGAASLAVWAGDGAFGAKGSVLDGIAIVRGHVVVNTLETGKLFSVPIGADGRAGAVTEVKLDRALAYPDGQRAYGTEGILVVEGGEGGRLSHVALSGANLDTGKVTTIKAGFPDDAAAVTIVGDVAYVLEAQFGSFEAPAGTAGKPFKATAVPLKR